MAVELAIPLDPNLYDSCFIFHPSQPCVYPPDSLQTEPKAHVKVRPRSSNGTWRGQPLCCKHLTWESVSTLAFAPSLNIIKDLYAKLSPELLTHIIGPEKLPSTPPPAKLGPKHAGCLTEEEAWAQAHPEESSWDGYDSLSDGARVHVSTVVRMYRLGDKITRIWVGGAGYSGIIPDVKYVISAMEMRRAPDFASTFRVGHGHRRPPRDAPEGTSGPPRWSFVLPPKCIQAFQNRDPEDTVYPWITCQWLYPSLAEHHTRRAVAVIQRAINEGEDVFTHCKGGNHRAPPLGGAAISILEGMPWILAMRIIARHKVIDLDGFVAGPIQDAANYRKGMQLNRRSMMPLHMCVIIWLRIACERTFGLPMGTCIALLPQLVSPSYIPQPNRKVYWQVCLSLQKNPPCLFNYWQVEPSLVPKTLGEQRDAFSPPLSLVEAEQIEVGLARMLIRGLIQAMVGHFQAVMISTPSFHFKGTTLEDAWSVIKPKLVGLVSELTLKQDGGTPTGLFDAPLPNLLLSALLCMCETPFSFSDEVRLQSLEIGHIIITALLFFTARDYQENPHVTHRALLRQVHNELAHIRDTYLRNKHSEYMKLVVDDSIDTPAGQASATGAFPPKYPAWPLCFGSDFLATHGHYCLRDVVGLFPISVESDTLGVLPPLFAISPQHELYLSTSKFAPFAHSTQPFLGSDQGIRWTDCRSNKHRKHSTTRHIPMPSVLQEPTPDELQGLEGSTSNLPVGLVRVDGRPLWIKGCVTIAYSAWGLGDSSTAATHPFWRTTFAKSKGGGPSYNPAWAMPRAHTHCFQFTPDMQAFTSEQLNLLFSAVFTSSCLVPSHFIPAGFHHDMQHFARADHFFGHKIQQLAYGIISLIRELDSSRSPHGAVALRPHCTATFGLIALPTLHAYLNKATDWETCQCGNIFSECWCEVDMEKPKGDPKAAPYRKWWKAMQEKGAGQHKPGSHKRPSTMYCERAMVRALFLKQEVASRPLGNVQLGKPNYPLCNTTVSLKLQWEFIVRTAGTYFSITYRPNRPEPF